MPQRVLFVVEDKKTDHNVSTIFKRLLKKIKTEVVVYKYQTTIYDLYGLIKKKSDSTFLSILWERDKKQFPKDMIKPEDAFTSVYLIFDFDPSSHLFSLKKCDFLVRFFDDETRNGKLYFDYPMSESIFDFKSFRQSLFNKRIVLLGKSADKYYKKSVRKNSYIYKIGVTRDFGYIKGSLIKSLLKMNLNKYLFLTREKNNGESFCANQKTMLSKEKEYFVNNEISVLCSSLLLIADYNYSLIEELVRLPTIEE